MAVYVDKLPNNTKLLSNSKPLVVLGCCGDTLLIDFTTMEFYPQFLPDPQISWSDSNLWQLLFIILMVLPTWVLICSLILQKKKLANTQLGETVTALSTAVFLILSFIKFINLLQDQPHWNFLQSNIFIGIGYFIIFIGLCHLQQGTKSLGVHQIFRANSAPKSSPVKPTKTDFPTCTSSFGIESTLYFGNSLLHLGTSLIYASQTGMLITFALGLSYTEIMLIRKKLGMKLF